MKPHFYKAKSRLGMINVPLGEKELNLGVEFGSDSVLSKDFLNLFSDSQIDEFVFTNPEGISAETSYQQVIANESKIFSELINGTLNYSVQVVIGGDHSVALGSILSVFERVSPEKVGVIYIDSHADLHKFSTSPSGNFHGMHMRALIDRSFDSEEINKIVDEKYLPYANIFYIGNMNLESEEINFIEENGIQKLEVQGSKDNIRDIKDRLKDFIQRFEHLHISFDIDVFNSALVTATGIKNPNGLMMDEIDEIISVVNIFKPKSYSIDLVEVNPSKGGIEKTSEIAQNVLIKLLK